MKNTIYILVSLFISGCASIYVSDLSKETNYSSYIGHDFKLKNNAIICKDGYLGDSSSAAPKGNQLIFKKPEDSCHGIKPIANLKEGTSIHINKVLMHHHFPPMWRHIYFLGSVKLPNNSIEKFYYFYGFDSDTGQGELLWN